MCSNYQKEVRALRRSGLKQDSIHFSYTKFDRKVYSDQDTMPKTKGPHSMIIYMQWKDTILFYVDNKLVQTFYGPNKSGHSIPGTSGCIYFYYDEKKQLNHIDIKKGCSMDSCSGPNLYSPNSDADEIIMVSKHYNHSYVKFRYDIKYKYLDILIDTLGRWSGVYNNYEHLAAPE